MKRKMNIVTSMGIFLIIIQSVQCDSSFFRERHSTTMRSIRGRDGKFDSSNRISQRNSFTIENNNDREDAASTADSGSGTINLFRFHRKTFHVPKYSDENVRSRRISMTERSTSESVIELKPEVSNVIQLPKLITLNGDIPAKINEQTRTRRDIIKQRRSLSERSRLIEDKRMIRLKENIKLRKYNVRFDIDSGERMSNIRDTEIRKTIRQAKCEASELSTHTTAPREIVVLYRQTRFSGPKRYSFDNRMKNIVRQEINGPERYVKKSKYNVRNFADIKLNEISLEHVTDSKLQQPRYERHLLVPKRELKIPSDGLRDRVINSRQYRKSIRTNDKGQGNSKETLEERKNNKGLRRIHYERIDLNRGRSTEFVEVRLQTRIPSIDSLKSRNQIQTRRNIRNTYIESSERLQNGKQTDALGSTRRNAEVPTRSATALIQAPENNSPIKKLRFNDLTSNRLHEKRFSGRKIYRFSKKRVHSDGVRISEENKKLLARTINRISKKEDIQNEVRIRNRNMRNQDRERDSGKTRMKRTLENEFTRKQRNAIVTSTNEIILTNTRSLIKEHSSSVANDKLYELRSRNSGLRIRDGRIGRQMQVETRHSITRLQTPLNERVVKFFDEYRNSVNKRFVSVRNIATSSLRLGENIQRKRSNEKALSFLDINMRKANGRIAPNQHSGIRGKNIFVRTENERHVLKELERYREVDSHSRRTESRINTDRVLRIRVTRDEFKQSKLLLSPSLMREPSRQTVLQTRAEINSRKAEQQRRKIYNISKVQYFFPAPELHSTAMNSTSKEHVGDNSAWKVKDISLKRLTVSLDRTMKLRRSNTDKKSSSSNMSYKDFYEYLSEKRSNFMSLILNVILGLAVIVASSDDKNKGFIPRRLTPFVDGFLKYTTVL